MSGVSVRTSQSETRCLSFILRIMYAFEGCFEEHEVGLRKIAEVSQTAEIT